MNNEVENQLAGDFWYRNLAQHAFDDSQFEWLSDRVLNDKHLSIEVDVTKELASLLFKNSKENKLNIYLINVTALAALLSRYHLNSGVIVSCGETIDHNVKTFSPFFWKFNLINRESFRDLLKIFRDQLSNGLGFLEYNYLELLESFRVNKICEREDLERFSFDYSAKKPFDPACVNSELHISLELCDNNLKLIVYYRYKCSPELVRRFANQFLSCLGGCLSSIDGNIQDLTLVTSQESYLLAQVNSTSHPLVGHTLVDLFEICSMKYADRIAVVYKDSSLSYGELDRRSFFLARFIREKMSGDKGLVGVIVERSLEHPIVLMGILRSGSGYVPIDPSYPLERRNQLIGDCGLSLVITDDLSGIINGVYYLNILEEDTWSKSGVFLEKVELNDIAYVIHTSGSTGSPKGVAIPHEGIVNRLSWMYWAYAFNGDEVIFQKTPNIFDVSVWELFLSMCYGLTQVQCSRDVIYDPEQLCDHISRYGVTTIHFVPGMYDSFLSMIDKDRQSQLVSLRHVMSSGEALSSSTVRSHYRIFSVPLHNLYGPTEASVDVSYYETHVGEERVPIGVPIWNTQLYVLNSGLLPQGIGQRGELYIGGVGVAFGYLNKPEQTFDRFIANPFGSGYLYKTGDICYWNESCQLCYVSRNDNQIKIRGYRIELGEIEHALQAHSSVKQAVVTVRDDGSGDKELIGYVSFHAGAEGEGIQDHLREKLPSYMQPADIQLLDDFPVTTSGKLDRQAISKLRGTSLIKIQGPHIAARNPIEETLIKIWSENLNLPVGIDHDYFASGGDSIKAIRLIVNVNHQLNASISLTHLYEYSTIRRLSSIVGEGNNQILESKIARSVEEEIENIVKNSFPLPNEYEAVYPLSDIQYGMIFHNILSENHNIYQDQFFYQFVDDSFDITALKESLFALVRKHFILRTSFSFSDFNSPFLIVHLFSKSNVNFLFEDITEMSANEQLAYMEKSIKLEKAKKFDVEHPGLWRMRIFKIKASEYSMLWIFHHAILDGWSNASFLTELGNVYVEFKSGPVTDLSPVDAKYIDFIIDQRKHEYLSEQSQYWQDKFSDFKRCELPLKANNVTAKQTTEIGNYLFTINDNLHNSLLNLCVKLDLAIQDVTLAALLILLKVTTNSDDITVGIVTHTRPEINDAEKVLGCFLNSIPIRCKIGRHECAHDFLRRINNEIRISKSNGKLSLRKIASLAKENMSTNPFFDILFHYTDFHVYQNLNDNIITRNASFEGYEATNTLFDFLVDNNDNRLNVNIRFRSVSYTNDELTLIHGLYEEILMCFINNEELSNTSIIPKPQQDLIESFSEGPLKYHPHNLLSVYNECVKCYPNDIAVAYYDQQLSYLQLDNHSNSLAEILKGMCIEPGIKIGVSMHPSEWLPVALLGILKTGATFVPIDLKMPNARCEYIITDADITLLLTDSASLSDVLTFYKGNLIAVDLQSTASAFSDDKIHIDEQGSAYVIYTSGSTGRPKGVEVSISNLSNYICWANQYYFGNVRGYHFGLLTNISFDLSLTAIFTTLCRGDELHIYNTINLTETFEHVLNVSSVNTLKLTPSHITLFSACKILHTNLSTIIVGGEILRETHVEILLKINPEMRIYNEYGPTETTVGCTVKNVTEKTLFEISIGKPIDNTKAYIVDNNLELLPVGVPGELLIAGRGVANGYLNSVDLSHQRFLTLPFFDSRVYRTGDWAMWLENGDLQFYGRKDNQVKISGHRIELDEIENVIIALAEISNAAVIVLNQGYGLMLCAYYSGQESVSVEDIRKHCQDFLPDFMIPQRFIYCNELPLTSNGKIDRKTLNTFRYYNEGVVLVEPTNAFETQLISLWTEFFDRPVSREADFFQLGGNSLTAIQLVLRMQQALQIDINLNILFSHPVLKDLTDQLIDNKTAWKALKIISNEDQTHYPISIGQRQLWVSEQMNNTSSYNITNAWVFKGLREDVFECAFNKLIEKHESLRTSFLLVEGEIRQRVSPFEERQRYLQIKDYTHLKNADEIIHQFYSTQSSTKFRLNDLCLFAASLIRKSNNTHVFIFSIHHIVSDGWSLNVMCNDIAEFYNSIFSSTYSKTDNLIIQYRDYAIWQKHVLPYKDIAKQKAYWLNKLSNAQIWTPDLGKPVNAKPGLIIPHSIHWEKNVVYSLMCICEEERATLFSALVACVKILLYRISGRNDLTISTPVARRNLIELENQIGYYVNMVALRTTLDTFHSFRECVSLVFNNTVESFEHQDYPYDELAEEFHLRNPSQRLEESILISLDDTDVISKGLDLNDCNTSEYDRVGSIPQRDLMFLFMKSDKGVGVQLHYRPSAYDIEAVKYMGNLLDIILRNVVDDPNKPISSIHLLPKADRIKNSSHIEKFDVEF